MEAEVVADLFDNRDVMQTVDIYPGNRLRVAKRERFLDILDDGFLESLGVIIDDGDEGWFTGFLPDMYQRSGR